MSLSSTFLSSADFDCAWCVVVSLVGRAGLGAKFPQLSDQLTRCQKSLNEFLEEKRSAFPRFYFIGDDDLLEILGQSTDPNVIQVCTEIYAMVFDCALCSLTETCKDSCSCFSLLVDSPEEAVCWHSQRGVWREKRECC